ncbi:hypothetical protein PV10_06251 [Exophiala mesophila]|uniref:HIT-type domain-containing protein n=1 Tax=Exophiala mesophila TaxID=212818 RepID=A0A0D1ZCR4_EXOME|nr:uncharacterized protein PV10_06251 [Exophiala mesophila]KIV91744.1 hypothetical protein PV10_06251 [Exophiala mesophila]
MPLIEELPVTTNHHRATHGWTYVPDISSSLLNPPPPPASGASSSSAAAALKSRKRGRDGVAKAKEATATSRTGTSSPFQKLSAKQEKAIQQRLNDLNKENARDMHIPIPKREAGPPGSARAKDRKPTSSVRRILAYSRTFQHYLADEEAGVNVYGNAGTAAAAAAAAASAASGSVAQATLGRKGDAKLGSKKKTTSAKTAAGGKKSGTSNTKQSGGLDVPPTQAVPTSTPASTSIKAEPDTDKPQSMETGDVDMTDAPNPSTTATPNNVGTLVQQPSQLQSQPQPQPQINQQDATAPPPAVPSTSQTEQPPPSSTQPQPQPQSQPPPPRIPSPSLDSNPLLKTLHLPLRASTRLITHLLSEPPLSYLEARAKPLEYSSTTIQPTGTNTLMAKPARHFCVICGYWGKVRCGKGCGDRVCGQMECWRAHEGVCTLGAY